MTKHAQIQSAIACSRPSVSGDDAKKWACERKRAESEILEQAKSATTGAVLQIDQLPFTLNKCAMEKDEIKFANDNLKMMSFSTGKRKAKKQAAYVIY